MSDFPEWVREALRARFDRQSLLALDEVRLKMLREKVQARTERIMRQADDALKGDLLLWEEEMSTTSGQEAEEAYMKGVRDGAELVIALICRSREPDLFT
ncbi:hypothetical protein [Paenibacillus cymbidii]|uniref:hypothetical protein n=1 Tax=Paenibacillus cymbidii TaxID=1639034 RepID=UPI0010803366|nr:hypothetical protein [Paenibacillus cymbidii]